MVQRLAMLAGHGQLVREGADAALADDWLVQVIDLVGRDDISDLQPVSASPTNPVSIWLELRKFKPTHICMIGAVNLSDSDRAGIAGFLRGKSKSAYRGKAGPGGDSAMSQLSRLLEFSTGAKVVGIHQIVGGLLAPAGLIAGPPLSKQSMEHAAFALKTARAVGELDAGQAIVTAGSRIIAIEDIAGTDALITRVGEYRRQGMTGDGVDPLVLTKCRKPGQLGTIDLPAIGPDTIDLAARSGIATIVVQSQHTLLISRQALIDRADELGVSIVGLEAEAEPDA